jgi:hypothetical protein
MSIIMKFMKISTDRAFPSRFDHLPREIDIVRIEEAQGPLILAIIGPREHFLEQDTIAVFAVGENIRSVARLSAKLRSAPRIGVNEVILVEGRNGVQRDQRASLDQIAPGFGDVVT